MTGAAAGAAQIYGSYFYLSALRRFEASRVVPIIGSLVPIFGFFLDRFGFGRDGGAGAERNGRIFFADRRQLADHGQGNFFQKERFGFVDRMAALLFALIGGVVKIGLFAAAVFERFLADGFWIRGRGTDFPFVRLGAQHGFPAATRRRSRGRPNFLFFVGQVMGGGAFLLQSLAMSLAPQASVPVINAMAGIQYVFIFIFSMILAARFPGIFKEKATRARTPTPSEGCRDNSDNDRSGDLRVTVIILTSIQKLPRITAAVLFYNIPTPAGSKQD